MEIVRQRHLGALTKSLQLELRANGEHPDQQPITNTLHAIMVKTSFGALALAALPSALAFRNTSPFFLFSTAK